MTTRLKSDQVERVRGLCFGCAHALPGKAFPGSPGTGRVCVLCLRNLEASKDASLESDLGKIVYGLRDCYIATDRFEMELKMETFLKGSSPKRKKANG